MKSQHRHAYSCWDFIPAYKSTRYDIGACAGVSAHGCALALPGPHRVRWRDGGQGPV